MNKFIRIDTYRLILSQTVKPYLLLATFVILFSGLCIAEPVTYDEVIDGDIPHQSTNLYLNLEQGVNSVVGTSSSSIESVEDGFIFDSDWFYIVIPDGQQLTDIRTEFSNLTTTGSALNLRANFSIYNVLSAQIYLEQTPLDTPLTLHDEVLPLGSGTYLFQVGLHFGSNPPGSVSINYSLKFTLTSEPIYDESVDGDLPESYIVNLAMGPGFNTVLGTNSISDSGDNDPVSSDWDWFKITVPSGYLLSTVNVEYSNLATTGSILGLEAYLAFYSLLSEQVELLPTFPNESISVLEGALPLEPGEYQFQMISNNASFFPPFAASYDYKVEFILISVVDEPPTANAGEDQAARVGDTVVLDGTQSFDDNTPTASLSYNWSFVSLPIGSSLSLTQADTANPSFVVDALGEYTAELVVTDNLNQSSVADYVLISTNNLAPSSDAGSDQLVVVNTLVSLDGSASYDPELDDIIFTWSIVSAPSGSNVSLTDTDTVSPSLVPDVEGAFELQLVTSDAIGAGAPAFVTIMATLPEEYAEIKVMNAAIEVGELELVEVTTAGNQNALTNFFTQATVAINAGDKEEAIAKLEQAISRVDGCALRDEPDGKGKGRDWVTDCTAQADIYKSLTLALEALIQSQ
ncbi:PKD domain-containing protein [Psychromonas sp.]|uniref:PKD domain-containing protein n=1 Tax=Psychromonas sp. TaxID=1884585 RepID=UPI00356458F8